MPLDLNVLIGPQRKIIRNAFVEAFDLKSLTRMLDEELDKDITLVVGTETDFGDLVYGLIRNSQKQGWIDELLTAAERTSKNVHIVKLRQNLGMSQVATPAAGAQPAAGPTPIAAGRPFLIRNRPVLNRHGFWQQLDKMAAEGGNRVLLVSGGVGKSHSLWPASYVFSQIKQDAVMATVEINAGSVVDVDASRLATLIAIRLWGGTAGLEVDEFSQAARQTKDLAGVLIQRFSALTKPTWLIIDQLDLVNLDSSATDLLSKVCKAVDAGECRQLWLLLLGLDQAKTGAKVGNFLETDVVTRPVRKDIEDYVMWFANKIGRPLNSAALAPVIEELDIALGQDPDHGAWESFHKLLRSKCIGIQQGTLP